MLELLPVERLNYICDPHKRGRSSKNYRHLFLFQFQGWQGQWRGKEGERRDGNKFNDRKFGNNNDRNNDRNDQRGGGGKFGDRGNKFNDRGGNNDRGKFNDKKNSDNKKSRNFGSIRE